MTPGQISKRIVAERLDWIETMIVRIRALPLQDRQVFRADARNVAAAESYLRRALEALLDLGRHILAKGLGYGVSEYKQIAAKLCELDVLAEPERNLLVQMAGYRNRLVHFYHEIGEDELFQICTGELGDLEQVAEAIRCWICAHPEQIDETL